MISDVRYTDPNYILNKLNTNEDGQIISALISNNGPKFNYPNCGDTCLNELKTIPGANYLMGDGRCFKANVACDKYECIDPAYHGDRNVSTSGYFSSCIPLVDTRLSGTVARYIRIERGNSILPVSIDSIEAYNIFGTFIKPITGRAYPTDGDNYGINLLQRNPEFIAQTTNEPGAYVQIDLGQNYTVYLVIVVNAVPFDNIVNTNLVLINNDKMVTYRYPIGGMATKTYYINTVYDKKYSVIDEYVKFEPYSYPSCVEEGCLYNNDVIFGNKYMFDHPIPKRDEDLLIPFDNRCFNTSLKCNNDCLKLISEGIFDDEDIDKYFVSCDDTINTLYRRVYAKFIKIERLIGSNLLELSELEAFNGSIKYKFIEAVTYPYDSINPPSRLIDGVYTSVAKTLESPDANIQAKIAESDKPITYINVSIPSVDIQKIYGTILYVINESNIVVHSFEFTYDSIKLLKQLSHDTNVITLRLVIDGSGSFVGTTKNTRNIFAYPSCVDYCTNNGQQFTDNIYNLPDGRCVIPRTNCNITSCLNPLVTNTLPLQDIYNNYSSCNINIDTRIIPSYGRYIRIQQESSSAGFDLNEIFVLGQVGNILIESATSYPVATYNNNLMYAKYAYDQVTDSYAGVKTSITQQKPYMQFDLGEDKFITGIKLLSFNESLNGTTVYVITSNSRIAFSTIVSGEYPNNYYYINTAMLGAINQDIDLPSMSMNIIYSYPDCIADGCIVNGHFIQGQQYENAVSNTCVIANNEEPSCYTNYGNLYGPAMDACFRSCNPETDTRYPIGSARYVRIRNAVNAMLTVSELNALDVNGVPFNIISAYSKGVTGISERSDNLINKSGTTSVYGIGSYVQIDLGSNKNIYKVNANITPIGNYVLELINENGMVISSNNITTSGMYSTRANVAPSTVVPSMSESFNYPACSTSATFADCVDVNGNTKPLFKYTLPNGACGIAKTTCSSCLTKLADGSLTQEEADMYFNSCSTTGETRYPALRGRYVRIQSTNNAFRVMQLQAFASDASNATAINVTDTFAYPSSSNSRNLITGDASTDVLAKKDSIYPFVQLDLGSDTLIGRVGIKEVTGDTSLTNTTLYIISDSGDTVFQKVLNPFTNSVYIAKFPGTYASQSTSFTFDYPSCKTTGCLTDGHQILNQQYNIGDRCFKAANTSLDSTCLATATTLYGSNMDNCFGSCSTTTDTRYIPAVGKYVRLTRTTNTDMLVSELKAYDQNNILVDIYSTYASGCNDVAYRSDNINISGKYVKVSGTGSYIQIMFDASKTISNIKVSVPSGYTFNNMLDTTLNILDEAGKVVSEYTITSSSPLLSDVSKTFIMKANMPGTTTKTLTSEYSYPSCVTDNNFECVSATGKSKPNIKYNLSDGRCAVAKTRCDVIDCMSKLNGATLTSAEMSTNFGSCDPNRMTQFSSITGRYVRIEQVSPATTGFTVKGVETYSTTKLTASSTRSFPLYGTNYSKYMMDPNDLTLPTRVGDAIADASGTTVQPFVQLDYASDSLINKITITTNGDTSLQGTVLKVINDNDTTVFQTTINLSPGVTEYTYYTNNVPNMVTTNSNMMNTFNYPACVSQGCTDEDKQIYGQKYNLADGRCVIAAGTLPVSQCLGNIDNLTGSAMDTCFTTCTGTTDTRYTLLKARFIRVRQTGTRTGDIKLFKLYATDFSTGTFTTLNIYSTHCQPIISYDYRSDNLNTNRVNPAGTTGSNAYIQIDLGSDVNITAVTLKWQGDITGAELIAITQAGLVKYKNVISGDHFKVNNEGTYNVGMNVTGTSESITVAETFTYPASKTTYNGGLDENNKPKLLFRYNLDNNLSVICISSCTTNDCLLAVNNNTMTLADMNKYFISTSLLYDTRFPNPSGRYIIIKRTDGTKNGFKISSITFDNLSVVATLAWPVATGSYSTSTITGTVAAGEPGVPYLQFDLGDTNKKVQFINITLTDTTLNGTTLYFVNADGINVFQKSISSFVVGNNKIELLKIPGMTLDSITTSYKFNFPTCKPSGCTPSDKQFNDQMYVTDDLRCFKAIGHKSLIDCLNKIDTLSGAEMDACFASCQATETRYPRLNARFVRIRQTASRTSDIKLFKLIANADNTSYPVVTKHCKPIIDYTYRSDNLNANRLNPAGTTGSGAYIQIDLGSNVPIDNVTIKRSGTIGNTELIIIAQDGIVKHKTTLTDTMFSTGDEIILPVLLNQPGSTETITIIEQYNYPATKNTFDGGLDENNRAKLLYKYVMDNGLSVVTIANCEANTCLDSVYNNTFSLTEMNNTFISTSSTTDTRFPNPIGKYIRIQSSDSTGFTITGMQIKGSDLAADVWSPIITMVYPLTSSFTTSNISSSVTGEPDKPFIHVTLSENKKIKYVNLTTTVSLSNLTLYVIDENGNTVSQTLLNNPITGTSKTFEILKIPGTLTNVPMSYAFNYDACVTQGCTSSDSKHYPGQKYKMSDGRCFKAVGYQPTSTCLTPAKNSTLFGSNMDGCFESCELTYDSRYPAAVGRFIRLSRASGVTGITLNGMVAYKPPTTIGGSSVAVVPLTAYVKNASSTTQGGDKLIDGLANTISSCTSTGYMQIDLGSDNTIDYVELLSSTSSALVGTKLQIIKDNGILTHETILSNTNNTYTTNTVTVKTRANTNGTTTVTLMEEFTWPCADLDCVSTNERTKPKFKYNISGGRCVVAKDTGVDNIMTNITNYSLSTDDVLAHFDSCNASSRTQFTSVTGRYVRIRRINNTTGPINISNFVIKSMDGTTWTTSTTKTYVKPLKTTAVDTYSYGKYMVDNDLTTATITDSISGVTPLDATLDKGYVQIDLGQDREIGSIELSHNGSTTAAETLNNTELVIVASNGNITYRQSVPTASTNRVLTIQNLSVPAGYTFNNSEIFNYPGCKAAGCLTEDDKIIKDFRYRTTDGRCFKAKLDTTAKTILDSAVSKDQTLNINTYFASCDASSDTRYIPAQGRYVRVERTDGTTLKLSRLEAHDNLFAFIVPVDVHVKPALNTLADYDKLKEASSTTNVSTAAGTVGSASYIQIDLGSNKTVREVVVNPSSTDTTNTYLYGSTLYIIKEDGTITYSIELNSTTLASSSFIVY